MKTFIASLSALVLVLTGCATTSGEAGEPDYANSAEENLKKGNEALESKNYLEAEKYFDYVKTKYPYLEASKDAELRAADTLFERERYVEARDAYQSFVKLHPTHPKVDYAAYRAALTHAKDFPSEFFLLPPSYEKDQGDVKGAVRAMNDFIRQYPNSQYVPEAKKWADDAKTRLARHEMYVGDFYRKREKWAGAAGRYETVVKNYSGLGFDEDALFGMYESYSKLGQSDKAKAALQMVIQKLPGTSAAAKAQGLLGKG
ncbi:MAG: outer membrane protein assembly factor BamD [Myxococcaceae bacterium]